MVPCVFWEKGIGDWSIDPRLECAPGQAAGTGRVCAACPGTVPAACPPRVLLPGSSGELGRQYPLSPALPWMLAEMKACAP